MTIAPKIASSDIRSSEMPANRVAVLRYNMRDLSRAAILDAYVATSAWLETAPRDWRFLQWADQAGIVFG